MSAAPLELLVLAPQRAVEPVAVAAELGLGARRLGSQVAIADLVRDGHPGFIERAEQLWMITPGRFGDAESVGHALEDHEDLGPRLWVRLGPDKTSSGDLMQWPRGQQVPPLERAAKSAAQALAQDCALTPDELAGLVVTELLPANYALSPDERVRAAASPDPKGESKLMRQVVVGLSLVMAGLATFFALR